MFISKIRSNSTALKSNNIDEINKKYDISKTFINEVFKYIKSNKYIDQII